MSLPGNDICLLEVEDFNLYEEEATDHAFAREGEPDKQNPRGGVKMEAEKRIRREIANSNERRRMQSINAGFQALRTLLPRHEGEKLSKAAILQQTAEYIYSLEQEKTRLLSQNCQLKRLLNQHEGGEIPLKKRKNDILSHTLTASIIPDSTDDTVLNARSPEPLPVVAVNIPKKDENNELRVQLERERRLRVLLEEQVRALEVQAYPDVHDLSRHASPDALYEESDRVKEEEEAALESVAPVALVAPPTAVTAPVTDPAPPAPAAPLLEAVIKVEPPVEVEMLPDAHDHPRLYLASTSRQNLETIVEAIRHLEGDHLFRETGGPEGPLALTVKPETRSMGMIGTTTTTTPRAARPGVIVVKHS